MLVQLHPRHTEPTAVMKHSQVTRIMMLRCGKFSQAGPQRLGGGSAFTVIITKETERHVDTKLGACCRVWSLPHTLLIRFETDLPEMLIPEDHPFLHTQDDAQSHDIRMEMERKKMGMSSWPKSAQNYKQCFTIDFQEANCQHKRACLQRRRHLT